MFYTLSGTLSERERNIMRSALVRYIRDAEDTYVYDPAYEIVMDNRATAKDLLRRLAAAHARQHDGR